MVARIRWDEEFASAPIESVGGKARGLGALISAGLPVPAAFCITTEGRRSANAGSGLDAEIQAALAQLRARGASAFAVRSSYVSEDTADALSPGVYLSEVGLTDDCEVLSAVRRVWKSAASPQAVEYRRSRGITSDATSMAVIVQSAPKARAGGVIYTLLPDTGDPRAVLIEYAAGAPGNVIDNLVPPRRFVMSKRDDEPTAAGDGPVDSEQLRTLASWAICLEKRLDGPLDLEWLLDDESQLFMLQARRLPYPRFEPIAPFTTTAVGTALRSDKLTPFRLRGRLEVSTIDAHLILPSAFAAYRVTGEIPEECRTVFELYAEHGPVSVRSVYWSALNSGDMLPQSSTITSVKQYTNHLARYWDYVAEHGLADYSAEVALLVSNWTDLRASVIASGGGATRQIAIGALFGQLEGLETCAHDTYLVDLVSLQSERADVPYKPLGVTVPRQPPQPLPKEMRDRRVLDESEVTAVAANVARLAEHLGPVRVELLILNGTSPATQRVVTWQVTQLSSVADLRYFRLRQGSGDAADAVTSGKLLVIRNPQEAFALARDPDEQAVIGIDFEDFEMRDRQLATALAEALRSAGRPVLLKGSILSHFAAMLREYEVTVLPVNVSFDGFGNHAEIDVVSD